MTHKAIYILPDQNSQQIVLALNDQLTEHLQNLDPLIEETGAKRIRLEFNKCPKDDSGDMVVHASREKPSKRVDAIPCFDHGFKTVIRNDFAASIEETLSRFIES